MINKDNKVFMKSNSVGTNRDVHGMHYQREKLRITDKAKNYLLSELSKRNCRII